MKRGDWFLAPIRETWVSRLFFRKPEPVWIGVDLAKPGSDRTAYSNGVDLICFDEASTVTPEMWSKPMASRNREKLQEQFEKDGKTRYVRTEDVEAEILTRQFHHFVGTNDTVCCITLKNGFTVGGRSSCANPDNFEVTLGEDLAFDDAKQKIYTLLAFRICDVQS